MCEVNQRGLKRRVKVYLWVKLSLLSLREGGIPKLLYYTGVNPVGTYNDRG